MHSTASTATSASARVRTSLFFAIAAANFTLMCTALAIAVDEAGARVVQATDSCTGILVELTREASGP